MGNRHSETWQIELIKVAYFNSELLCLKDWPPTTENNLLVNRKDPRGFPKVYRLLPKFGWIPQNQLTGTKSKSKQTKEDMDGPKSNLTKIFIKLYFVGNFFFTIKHYQVNASWRFQSSRLKSINSTTWELIILNEMKMIVNSFFPPVAPLS